MTIAVRAINPNLPIYMLRASHGIVYEASHDIRECQKAREKVSGSDHAKIFKRVGSQMISLSRKEEVDEGGFSSDV